MTQADLILTNAAERHKGAALSYVLTSKDIGRFWSKTQKTETCWLWIAATDRKGYGYFSVGPKRSEDGSIRNTMRASHRVAYEIANGPIPDALWVLHKCDNPRCVNPGHLFLGTSQDNVTDMDQKGRRVSNPMRGSRHANAILDEASVKEIVRRHRERGETQAGLAAEYGVSISTVNHIFTGRLWAHLGLANQKRGTA